MDCAKAVPESLDVRLRAQMEFRVRRREPLPAKRIPCRLGEPGEEVDRRECAGDPLMILRSRLEILARPVRRRIELGDVERAHQRFLAVEDPHVRAVELVAAAGEEVAVPFAHVHELVRRVMHGIHEGERANGMRHAHRAGNVADGADAVRRRADSNESGA